MISEKQKMIILNNMIESLDLPDSAYEKAKKRYESIGEWFESEDSNIRKYNPHIFAQGSFRLGTAIRPINNTEEYDLDLACKLQNDFSKDKITQKELKKLIGEELEKYRIYHGIEKKLEEKHRCWRIDYKDNLSFHMDIVPCIPEGNLQQLRLFESIRKTGTEEIIAKAASMTTVSITDDRHKHYEYVCENWNISNPEGYAKWFEYRMNKAETLYFIKNAKIDDVPLFKKKTPLQRVIQLLKRHRDNMFVGDEEVKPISIIITTLAAKAYDGEENIVQALENILNKIADLINSSIPKVPNPVDPEEDFADRWYREDCRHLNLEDNFKNWLLQAQKDFKYILSECDADFISKQCENKLALNISKSKIAGDLGIDDKHIHISTPKKTIIEREKVARPWAWVKNELQ